MESEIDDVVKMAEKTIPVTFDYMSDGDKFSYNDVEGDGAFKEYIIGILTKEKY